MTIYEFGDVVLVPFPFTDQTTIKKRPAVIISSSLYNSEKPDLVIMAVTSQIKTTLGFGEELIKDWSLAGLLKPSVLKPVITTVEKKLIIQPMGQLSEFDNERLKQNLRIILD